MSSSQLKKLADIMTKHDKLADTLYELDNEINAMENQLYVMPYNNTPQKDINKLTKDIATRVKKVGVIRDKLAVLNGLIDKIHEIKEPKVKQPREPRQPREPKVKQPREPRQPRDKKSSNNSTYKALFR